MAHSHKSPVDFEKEAAILREHFSQAETEILLMIKKHCMYGSKNPKKWRIIQTVRINKFKRELKAYIKRFKSNSKHKIDKLVYSVYLDCIEEYEHEMKGRYEAKEVRQNDNDYLFESNELTSISDDIANKMQKGALSKYKETIKSTDDESNNTLDYAIAASLINIAGDGIKSVIDNSGRKYRPGSYLELAGRGAFFHIGLNAMRRVLGAYDHELVQVSAHELSCPRCAPWQGEILSVNYESRNYMSLQQAEDEGLFHPNCHHFLYPYFDGEETEEPIEYDEEAYEAQQKQRYYERGIREWKLKNKLAEGKLKPYTARKINEWEDNLKQHLEDYPYLVRELDREKIKAS
ncbi:phage minor capsid protein [Listeria kieliensis]